jgi:hypothetical protein
LPHLVLRLSLPQQLFRPVLQLLRLLNYPQLVCSPPQMQTR